MKSKFEKCNDEVREEEWKVTDQVRVYLVDGSWAMKELVDGGCLERKKKKNKRKKEREREREREKPKLVGYHNN